jgi:capsular polysaccharide biosynthesis protein
MDIKKIITLVQRWMWLLLVGLIVGVNAGILASRFQEPVYRAKTQLLVSRSTREETTSFAGLSNQQLAQTYIQILKTKNLRSTTAERTGVQFDAEQINIQLLPDTQIVEISVEENDPENAANIANTMVDILIEENEAMVAGQFSALEESLNTQISMVEEQITNLQSDYEIAYRENYQEQLEMVSEQITSLEGELASLQVEMAPLLNKFALFNENPQFREFTEEDRAQLREKESRAAQLESNLKVYNEIRANLLVMGKPLQSSQLDTDQDLLQVKSTIDLYQEMYLNLLSSLEAARLARQQFVPTVVQIEEAFAPENPVRPILLLNALLSGMAGLALAVAVGLILDAISEIEPPVVEPKEPVTVVAATNEDKKPKYQTKLEMARSAQKESGASQSSTN